MTIRINQQELLELVPVEDVFVTGVALIEDVAGVCVRIVYYTEQTCHEAGGQKTTIIKAKVVMPWSAYRFAHKRAREMMMQREALRLVT